MIAYTQNAGRPRAGETLADKGGRAWKIIRRMSQQGYGWEDVIAELDAGHLDVVDHKTIKDFVLRGANYGIG